MHNFPSPMFNPTMWDITRTAHNNSDFTTTLKPFLTHHLRTDIFPHVWHILIRHYTSLQPEKKMNWFQMFNPTMWDITRTAHNNSDFTTTLKPFLTHHLRTDIFPHVWHILIRHYTSLQPEKKIVLTLGWMHLTTPLVFNQSSQNMIISFTYSGLSFFYTYHDFMVIDFDISLVGRQTIIWSNAEFFLINWTLTTRFGEM